MADATDSKSVEGNFIRVRLPSSAPEKNCASSFLKYLLGVEPEGSFGFPENRKIFRVKASVFGTREKTTLLPSFVRARNVSAGALVFSLTAPNVNSRKLRTIARLRNGKFGYLTLYNLCIFL